MKDFVRVTALAWLTGLLTVVLTVGTAPAGAQWLNYPTPGIPRTADGKPNLSAPTPRTADGTPDLSGMWRIDGLGSATNITGCRAAARGEGDLRQASRDLRHR